ncbi:MAG: CDGSH iron-sulfur domain-containing protein [Burkholderiales bacterium]
MSNPPSIECKVDGPYLVKDLDALANSKAEAIPCKPVMALCRCGGSATKPFCDGTHKKSGFSGARQTGAAVAKRDAYRGKKITITDDRAICAHSGHCTDSLAAVFKFGSDPWIDPDGAGIEAIIEAVRKCPSGALGYALADVEGPEQHREPGITVTKDGPYAVVGRIPLAGQSAGEIAATECYTLCRCGGSKNKPFCDGTHSSIGFKDEKN